MRKIKLVLAAALAVVAAATAGRTLSSDPEWRALPGKGTDVAMEELTLSGGLRDGDVEGEALTGDVEVSFRSDYFKLD